MWQNLEKGKVHCGLEAYKTSLSEAGFGVGL